MLREIKKKMVILHNRQPIDGQITAFLQELELKEWLTMHLRLCGSPMTEAEIEIILNGGFLRQGRIEDHVLIGRLREVRTYIYRQRDMQATLSRTILQEMHEILSGGAEEGLRKTNPIVVELSYNPMLPEEIPQAMDELVRFAGRYEDFEEPFAKAAQIHNRLLEIYPYKEGNALLARCAMYEELVRQGFPLAPIAATEQEYNDWLIHYLRQHDSQPLRQALLEAVYRKLELILQLTSRD